MSITYEQLEKRGATIYNKATGKAYGEGLSTKEANIQLASDLGIKPHQIDWAKISKVDTDLDGGSDLNNLGDQEFKMPPDQSFNGNAVDMTAGFQGLIDFFNEQLKNISPQLSEAKEEQKGLIDTFKEFLTGRTSQADIRAQEFADIGVDPKDYFSSLQAGYEEIGGLRTQYNDVVAEMNEKLDVVEKRHTTMTLIEGEQAQVQKRFESRLSKINSDIAAKAAVLQAKQGLFGEARQFVNEAVQSAVYDEQVKFDSLKTFIELNQNTIDGLSKDYKDALTSSLKLAEDNLKEKKADKTGVMNLMIQFPNAGITPEMSLEDASKAASEYKARVGEWEIRQIGNRMYRVNLETNETQLLAEAPYKDDKGEELVERSDEQIRAIVRGLQGEELSYQAVLDEITLDTGLANKDRARLIAAEMFGQPIPDDLAIKFGKKREPDKVSTPINVPSGFTPFGQGRGKSTPLSPGQAFQGYTPPSLPDFITNIFQ